jgi:plasmid stabilization system protein ParE
MRKVVLSRRAANKLDKLLEYLEANWSTSVKNQFLDKFTSSLANLSQFPEMGKAQNRCLDYENL